MPDRLASAIGSRRCENETARKLLHLTSLSMPVGYYALPKPLVISLIAAAFAVSCLLDVARFRHWRVERAWAKILAPILRPAESHAFSGASFILFSGWLCPLLYSRPAAAIGMTSIILGDAAAALVGRRWGTHTYGKRGRTWEGSAAFFCAAALGVFAIPDLQIFVGIGCAALAAVIEAVSTRVDDNLAVPVIVGLVAHVLLIRLQPL